MPPRRSKSVSTRSSPVRDPPALRKAPSKTNKIVKTKPDSSLYTYFTVLTPPPPLPLPPIKHEPRDDDDEENLDLFTDANGRLPPPSVGVGGRPKVVLAGETPRRIWRRARAVDGDNEEDGDWRSARLEGFVGGERRVSRRVTKRVNMALPPLELEFELENEGEVVVIEESGDESRERETVVIEESEDDGRRNGRWRLRKRKVVNMALPPLELEFEEEEDMGVGGSENVVDGKPEDVREKENREEQVEEDTTDLHQPERQQRRRSPRKRKIVNMALPPLELEFEEDSEDEGEGAVGGVQEEAVKDGNSVQEQEHEMVPPGKAQKKKTNTKNAGKSRGKSGRGGRGGRGGGGSRGGRKTSTNGRKGLLKRDVVPVAAEPVLLCVACVICGLRLDSMTATVCSPSPISERKLISKRNRMHMLESV